MSMEMETTTDPAKWLEAQPDMIICKAYKTKMTLRACQKRLSSPFHYKQLLHPGESEDGMIVNVGFRACVDSDCPHYVETSRRANCCRTNFGVSGRKSIQKRLDGDRDVYDFDEDVRAFQRQSKGIRAALQVKQEETAKSKLQSAYEARRAAGKAKRLKQDQERVGKMARVKKMKGQGKTFNQIADALGVHSNTVKRWTYEGPGRAEIFREKERLRRKQKC